MSRRFDAIIIGGGQAGRPLAGRLTQAGMTVGLIERKHLGGTCVNSGCTPTKTLVASAYAAHLARRAEFYGVTTGPIAVDMGAVRARKDAVVLQSRNGGEAWLAALTGCTVVRGHGRFVSPTEVQVGDELLAAERIFINVGARARLPDLPGINTVDVLTSTTLLDLDVLPRHLIIVGGSYIGLEFAQIFRRFGAEVTVIESGKRLVGSEDEDVSDCVTAILESEGIKVRIGAECIHFARRDQSIAVGVSCEAGDLEVLGSHVLLAVGRRPNTDDLGLSAAGIAVDTHGFITVDDGLRTTASNIWALGDCNGRGAFTHTAWNDFEIVAANLLDGETRSVRDRIPGYALYIDPPFGRAGLTERQAHAEGHRVRVGKRLMTRVGRAIEKGETQGFMKVIVDGDDDRILGAAILGVGGDEAIHGVLEAINAGLTATTYTRALPIHPTVSELIPTIFGELSP